MLQYKRLRIVLSLITATSICFSSSVYAVTGGGELTYDSTQYIYVMNTLNASVDFDHMHTYQTDDRMGKFTSIAPLEASPLVTKDDKSTSFIEGKHKMALTYWGGDYHSTPTDGAEAYYNIKYKGKDHRFKLRFWSGGVPHKVVSYLILGGMVVGTGIVMAASLYTRDPWLEDFENFQVLEEGIRVEPVSNFTTIMGFDDTTGLALGALVFAGSLFNIPVLSNSPDQSAYINIEQDGDTPLKVINDTDVINTVLLGDDIIVQLKKDGTPSPDSHDASLLLQFETKSLYEDSNEEVYKVGSIIFNKSATNNDKEIAYGMSAMSINNLSNVNNSINKEMKYYTSTTPYNHYWQFRSFDKDTGFVSGRQYMFDELNQIQFFPEFHLNRKKICPSQNLSEYRKSLPKCADQTKIIGLPLGGDYLNSCLVENYLENEYGTFEVACDTGNSPSNDSKVIYSQLYMPYGGGIKHECQSVSNDHGNLTCDAVLRADKVPSSCTVRAYDGFSLYADCKQSANDDTKYNKFDVRALCHDQNLVNSDGLLSCTDQSKIVGMPGGSWKDSCIVQGYTTNTSPGQFTLYCRDNSNKQHLQTYGYGTCKSTLSNRNGVLTCDDSVKKSVQNKGFVKNLFSKYNILPL